ncbi:hypothetical protein THAOC_30714 [Thalassiosira oceanica]|uniref:Uncharacterized protein n=1 Tax=Thalassiosira oceanica TaxID=159749 RepID=K0RUJ7_THAOC|nr:hypothetical protein THAOC_30714 [Thalassiosira oceanica]|eukprot:EJK50337.1 hypothetical protein THAOC_30714 [Thalassiosira oceanica]
MSIKRPSGSRHTSLIQQCLYALLDTILLLLGELAVPLLPDGALRVRSSTAQCIAEGPLHVNYRAEFVVVVAVIVVAAAVVVTHLVRIIFLSGASTRVATSVASNTRACVSDYQTGRADTGEGPQKRLVPAVPNSSIFCC